MAAVGPSAETPKADGFDEIICDNSAQSEKL